MKYFKVDMDSDDEHLSSTRQYKDSISQDDKLMLVGHGYRKKLNVGRSPNLVVLQARPINATTPHSRRNVDVLRSWKLVTQSRSD